MHFMRMLITLPKTEETPETSTISVSVKDTETTPAAVAGAKVTLTDKTDSTVTFTTGNTGAAGGATLSNVPYGTYEVSVTAPSGYTALESYDDFTVDSETETLNVSVDKD